MMHVALVITDPAKAREAEAMTYQRGGLRREATAIRQRPGRPAGSLWTHMATECPDGMPNCRNCGDPAFAETCKRDGHCPYCGTRHGIAPDSVVVAAGVTLVEITPPTPDEQWDVQTRRFVKRAEEPTPR
jgi:hypothetical protein